MTGSVTLWHRPWADCPWVSHESFADAAEAERLVPLITAAGEYLLVVGPDRPSPTAAPTFTVEPRTRTRGRVRADEVADEPVRGIARVYGNPAAQQLARRRF